MPTGTEPPPGIWARTVAQVIREQLDATGITQATLAERAGLGVATLSRCLTGRRSLTLDEVARCAAGLNLTPTHIVQRANMILSGETEPRAS